MFGSLTRHFWSRPPVPPPDVEEPEAIPASVMRYVNQVQVAVRHAGDAERVLVQLPDGGMLLDSPEAAQQVVLQKFPALSKHQAEDVALYLKRLVRHRRRMLRKQQRGPSWVTNY